MFKEMIFWIANQEPINSIYNHFYQKRVLRKAVAPEMPQTLSIETINVCNARCTICPILSMTRPKKVMPMELFKKIIDESYGVKRIVLSFYGEPMLDPHIFERIEYIRKVRPEIEVGLYTNASLLDELRAKKLADTEVDFVHFSFDGATKETYESIRKGLDFDVVVKNIRYFCEIAGDTRVYINFVITKENKGEIARLKKDWRWYGAEIEYGFRDSRNGESWPKYRRDKQGFACRRLFNECIVLSSGDVALCCMDYDGKVKLGNLASKSIRDVWNSSEFGAIRDLHRTRKGKNVPLCAKCDKLYLTGKFGWIFD